MTIFGRLAFVSLLAACPASAQTETTVLTVPMSVPLADLQAHADERLPRELHSAERSQTCVEAERACTKIPEFGGFKIYSRMEHNGSTANLVVASY